MQLTFRLSDKYVSIRNILLSTYPYEDTFDNEAHLAGAAPWINDSRSEID